MPESLYLLQAKPFELLTYNKSREYHHWTEFLPLRLLYISWNESMSHFRNITKTGMEFYNSSPRRGRRDQKTLKLCHRPDVAVAEPRMPWSSLNRWTYISRRRRILERTAYPKGSIIIRMKSLIESLICRSDWISRLWLNHSTYLSKVLSLLLLWPLTSCVADSIPESLFLSLFDFKII